MNPWIQMASTILTVLASSGLLYYSVNKRLKLTELKDKEIDVVKKQDEEWKKLYEEEGRKRDAAEKNCKDLALKNETLSKLNGLLELKNQQLTWYRCTINNCPNRRPPHVFDKDGNELEACS